VRIFHPLVYQDLLDDVCARIVVDVDFPAATAKPASRVIYGIGLGVLRRECGFYAGRIKSNPSSCEFLRRTNLYSFHVLC
jgi:hypothetical protein